MGFLKKSTPLWITIVIVIILAITVLYFLVPSHRIEKFRREAFSTHLLLDSYKVLIEDGRGGSEFDITHIGAENITEHEQQGDPRFWNLTIRLENEIYHMYYSIKMNGSNIAGTYSVKLTLQNASKVFTFTVATDEQLPRIFNFQWNTGISPTSQLSGSMSFHKGWSRTPSLGPLLSYVIMFLPEYFVAGILATTILVVLLAYQFVKGNGN